jgi:hypothetical protein
MLRNAAYAALDGEKIGYLAVHKWNTSDDYLATIGTATLGKCEIWEAGGSNTIRFQVPQATVGYEVAIGPSVDGTGRVTALWMMAGDNTVENNGATFATDLTGTGALNIGETSRIFWGGTPPTYYGFGVASFLGVMLDPTTDIRDDVEAALADFYGITFS